MILFEFAIVVCGALCVAWLVVAAVTAWWLIIDAAKWREVADAATEKRRRLEVEYRLPRRRD